MAFKTISQTQLGQLTALNSQTTRTGTSVTSSGPLITSVIVTDSGYSNLDDTAIGASNSFIKIIGSGFSSGANVYVGGTQVPAANVTFTSSTELRVIMPVSTVGSSNTISLFNSTGSGALYASSLLTSGFPTVTTSAYTSAALTISTQLLATGDGTLTYSLKDGSSLPSGLTLAANGLISGTATTDSATSFTVLVNDSQNQTTQQDITLTISTVDTYFNQTTLLVQADNAANTSTNGSVVDSSNNYNLVFSTGTPVQGSINPFGTGNWSNSFNGTNQYVSASANTAFAFSGDFTVELWVYPTTFNQYGCLVDTRSVNTNATGFYIRSQSSYTSGQWQVSNGTASFNINASTNLTVNTWQHVALVRLGSTLTLYLNGVSVGATTTSQNFSDGALQICNAIDNYYFPGYVSNFRILKGTALYTTTFTPSTTPLTAVANTQLLTCQSNRFKDESTNAFTITPTSSPTIERFNPFDVNANSYVTQANTSVGSTYYGSGYQYFPQTSFGTGDFSIEFWVYPIANGNNGSIFNNYYQYSPGDYGMYIAWLNTNQFETFAKLNNSVESSYMRAGTSLSLNQWYHVAVCRTSGTFSIFLNGTRSATTTYAQSIPNTQAGIGNNGSGSSYQGGSQVSGCYLSNFRIMTGSSAYNAANSSFTVPTSPLTVTANTTLLTCVSSQGNKDNARGTALTTVNSITQSRLVPSTLYSAVNDTSTSNTVYSGSHYFGGSDYLTIPTNTAFQFGTGDFTIECWVYKSAAANAPIIDARGSSVASPWAVYVDGSNFPYFYEGTSYTSTVAIVNNQWNHVAVTRSAGTLKIFVNGVQGYSGSVTTTLSPAATVYVGGQNFSSPAYTSGYISNLRILKGTAVYTGAFTPPTAPLQPVANTSLLLSGTNSGIYDATLQNNIRGSVATVNTNVFKYGTGSMFFNGTSDFLQIGTTPGPITPLLTAGATMTIEAWVYPTSLRAGGIVNTQPAILCLGATYMNFGVNNGVPTFYWYSGSSSSLASSISITANTWSHLAVVINGTGSNNLKIYVNGVLGGTGTFVNIPWNSASDGNSLYIGKEGGGTTSWWPGYIDELRITKSARYTANFTPPSTAFNSKSRSN